MKRRTNPYHNPWPGYLRIDAALKEMSYYVRFSFDSASICSERIAEVMLNAGSLLDTNLRTILIENGVAENPKRPHTMREYRTFLIKEFKNIENIVFISPFERDGQLKPWSGLAAGSLFPWWDAYNKVKHNRYKMLKHATLGSLYQLTAALKCVNHFMTYRDPHIRSSQDFGNMVFELSILYRDRFQGGFFSAIKDEKLPLYDIFPFNQDFAGLLEAAVHAADEETAQQVDAPEPATNVNPASRPSPAPAR